jgi:hypothetical protein
MDELKITGRIFSVGTGYMAVVSAVPTGGRQDLTNEHMTKVCESYLEAAEALKRLSVALGRQILERGQQITTVDLDDVRREMRDPRPETRDVRREK